MHTFATQLTTPLPSWKPHAYQETAIKLMISQACAGLLLDPGLGKTSTTLAAFTILHSMKLVRTMLVIAPRRVCYNVWPKEVAKWAEFAHLRVEILHGPQKDELLGRPADVYVINPEGLDWLFTKMNERQISFDMLVVDESTKFKHSDTKRFKAMRKMLHRFRRRYILTGTVAPNGLMDLFGQIYLLDEGAALGRYITHYRTSYFYPSGYGGYTWAPQHGALERISERIAPLVLRMQDSDYLQLPEMVNNFIEVELPDQARKVYRELERVLITEIQDHTVIAANAAVASGKCRQVANGALYTYGDRDLKNYTVLHTEKVTALVDLVEQLQGQPLLVLYEFDFDRDMIQDAMKDTPCFGGSDKKDSKLVDQFNLGVLPVVLGHPASIAHGLNLQGACAHVCWYGQTWNLEHYDQAIRRVRRQGQKADRVMIHHIVAKDTVDELVLQTLRSKDRTQATLMDALKGLRTH